MVLISVWYKKWRQSSRRLTISWLADLPHRTYVPFGIRRFSSFHIFSDNSPTWRYIPVGLFVYLSAPRLTSALSSSNLSGCWTAHVPATLPVSTTSGSDTLSLPSSTVSSIPPVSFFAAIHLCLSSAFSYLPVCSNLSSRWQYSKLPVCKQIPISLCYFS